MARTEAERQAAHAAAAEFRRGHVKRNSFDVVPDKKRDRGHQLAATNPPISRERVDRLLTLIDATFGPKVEDRLRDEMNARLEPDEPKRNYTNTQYCRYIRWRHEVEGEDRPIRWRLEEQEFLAQHDTSGGENESI